MTDTAIVLGQAAASSGRFEVVGQYSTGETYGAIYPKGSPNAATLDQVIQALIVLFVLFSMASYLLDTTA